MESRNEKTRRWRLILGSKADPAGQLGLTGDDAGMDATLDALYDSEREGNLGASSPNVNRWLGDIRRYFPTAVVQVLQRDALERLQLNRMLLEPELLESIEPDAELVGTLLSLSKVLPERTRETARLVVRRLADRLEQQLGDPIRRAVRGALHRAARTRRPRPGDIDWQGTIRLNLRHYQPAYNSIIPERLTGYQRRRNQLRDVVVLIDQSGSMASSVVYAGIFSCILASLPSLRTRIVAFDTAVVDLSDHLSDPVDLLFATQLGGGTDINQAVAYAEKLIDRPRQTVCLLITDLFEGGNRNDLLYRCDSLRRAGVKLVVLLALNDSGAPAYNHDLAQTLAQLDIPALACTPDAFPELLAGYLA